MEIFSLTRRKKIDKSLHENPSFRLRTQKRYHRFPVNFPVVRRSLFGSNFGHDFKDRLKLPKKIYWRRSTTFVELLLLNR